MTISIQGNATFIGETEFRPKIERCLKLLQTKALGDYTLINSYNLTIRAAARSGANFNDNTIDIARATFDASDTWLASVLLHETIHFLQYKSGKYKPGTPAEQEANGYQLKTLRNLGAPTSELSYMASQTGGHADLNGDGVYDWRDYQMRNY